MLSALACTVALISSYYLFRTIWQDVSGTLIGTVRTPVSPGRIERLEEWPREHPEAFDWHVHNKKRHLYITSNPPNPRKSMEHSNVILQHSIMDDYILRILSEWQIDKNNSAARTNLMRNAQSFSDLRFVAAACFLKIGELYAAEGNREEANASYLKIVEDKSMPSQYRTLAEEKLRGQKGKTGLPEALLPQITIGPWTINKKPEQQSSGDITSDFVGQWSGNVTQKRSNNSTYPVVITIHSGKLTDRVGSVNYATEGCGGELLLIAATSIRISVEERLTSGLTKCIDRSVIILTKNADGTLDYGVRVADVSGSGVLRKASH